MKKFEEILREYHKKESSSNETFEPWLRSLNIDQWMLLGELAYIDGGRDSFFESMKIVKEEFDAFRKKASSN